MRGLRRTGRLALSHEGSNSTGDPERDSVHGLRAAQELSPETLLYHAGGQIRGGGGRYTRISSHTGQQIGGAHDRVRRTGGDQRTAACVE